MNSATPPLLSFRGVVKQLGGTLAVAGVDLDIQSGEIHALFGANGASKSTLVKLLAGVHKPDEGEILFKGLPGYQVYYLWVLCGEVGERSYGQLSTDPDHAWLLNEEPLADQ